MTTDNSHAESTLKDWVIVSLLVILILFKGGLAYFVIGDLGQPDCRQ